MSSFQEQIEQLDPTLFEHIESETTAGDKISLLALHLAARKKSHRFKYLEIGSHLGGSLQALVVDPNCDGIVSIDPRPASQPDERGVDFSYPENTTKRMIENLVQIPDADVKKIITIDAGSDAISPDSVPVQPDLCFIDGEHTDEAALRDARFCLSVMSSDGCLVFHDAHVVYRGLDQLIREMSNEARQFRAYAMPDSIFVIELGGSRLSDCEAVRTILANGYSGYLSSMLANDHYRIIVGHPIVRMLRKIKSCFSSGS